MIEKIRSYIENAKVFLLEVKAEWKKVTWPTKQQLIAATILVVFLLIAVGIYIGIVDTIFSYIFRYVEKHI